MIHLPANSCSLNRPHTCSKPVEREDISIAANITSQSVITERMPGLSDRIVKGGVWNLAGRLGGVAATVVSNIVLAHALSPDEYGQFVLITTVIGLASVAAMCGVNGAIMRFVSESIGTSDARRCRRAFLLGARVALVVGLIVAIATTVLIFVLCQAMPVADGAIPVGIALLLLAWQQIAAEGLRSMQEQRLANLFSGGQSGGFLTVLLFTGLFVFWAAWDRPSLILAIWLYALAPMLTLPLALISLRRAVMSKLPRMKKEGATVNSTITASQFLSLSLSLLTIQMLAFTTTQADVWFVGAVLSTADVARYGAARRLLAIVVIPLQLVNLTVAPSIGEVFAAGRLQTLERMLRYSSTIAFSIAFLAVLVLAFAGPGMLGLLFGPWYCDGASVLLAFCLGQLVVAWCGSSGYTLVMTGRQTVELLITLRASLLLLLLAPLGAAFFGEIGIAAAVSISAAVKGLSEWLAVRRLFGLNSHPDFSVFLRPLLSRWQRLPHCVET